MKELIINLFGSYEPIVFNTQHQIVTSGGAIDYVENVSVVHPDFAWIFGVLGFFLVLFCVFRIIGGFFRR